MMNFIKLSDIGNTQKQNLTAINKERNEFGEIHFEDVSYSVPRYAYKFWRNETKEILHNVCGDFPSNKLSAIIGPSGCGKSTLMDIVSGYRSTGFSGTVYVNSEEMIHQEKFMKRNCYIMQDDELSPFLTVEEAMTFVTCICLPSTVTQVQRETMILKLLEDFSLLENRKTLTKDLSGGERKRLNIALELITNPPVLFLDEPTSGLDWTSAKHCIEILNNLSGEGKTIICSIHQPSMSLLRFFHHVYILVEGRCVYQGSVDNLIIYLSELNYECPTNYNPVEYVMDICSFGENNDLLINDLVDAIQNGRSQNWFNSPTCWKKISLGSTLHPPSGRNNRMNNHLFYATSFKEQTKYLIGRIVLSTIRDPFLTKTGILVNIIMGLTIGIIFYDIGNDATKANVNFNLLFYCILSVMFNAFMSRLLTVPQDIIVIRREHFNGRYSISPYFWATTLSYTFLQIFDVLIFSILVYFLTGQILEARRFMGFLISMYLLAITFQEYGMTIGMLMNVKNSMIFGIFTICPWVLFSGSFIFYRDTPVLFRIMFDISILRKALEAVMLSIYGYDRKSLHCPRNFCYFKQSENFLKEFDINDASFTLNIIFIVVVYIIVKIFSYLTLRYKVVRAR